MKSQPNLSAFVSATIGGIREEPQWVGIRLIPWFLVLLTARPWVWGLLGIGILIGPLLIITAPVTRGMRWGFDIVLLVLAWGGLIRLSGSWLFATGLASTYIGFLTWKGLLFSDRTPGRLMTLVKPDQSEDPALFVQRIVGITRSTLDNHGWFQREVLRNATELKRFQYKARLAPKGQMEIICFDDKFPGYATYPFR